MKRTGFFAGLAVVAVACGCAGDASRTTAILPPGADVTLPIGLQVAPGRIPTAVQADVAFDAARYRLVRVVAGDAALAAGKDVQSAAIGTGGVRLLVYGVNQTALASGTLATLVFSDATGGGAAPVVVLGNLSAVSGEGEGLPAVAAGPSVEVR